MEPRTTKRREVSADAPCRQAVFRRCFTPRSLSASRDVLARVDLEVEPTPAIPTELFELQVYSLEHPGDDV